MFQSQKSWCWKLELATFLTISGAIIALLSDCTLAQSNIVPDSTLGAESSRFNSLDSDSPIDEIQGGAIRGTNLFHSFVEFNVSEGRAAYFLSPNASIQNILARVTGGNVSEILGTLGTRGGSRPNLFLINPNGIIFGPNASLDVGGSFVASTASSLKFSDRTEFSAAEPQTSLLTVSVPTGLQFGVSVGAILNQSVAVDSRGRPVGLRVQPGKTLALVGGDILLENGNLTAEPGRIELGSVANSSLVGLIPNPQGWVLGYEGVQQFQDIHLSQAAAVYAVGRGGEIQVQGRRVTLTDGSEILSATVGSQAAGNVVVNAADSLELAGFTTRRNVLFPSSLRTVTLGSGATGNLIINTRQLIVRDGAFISASTDTGSTGQGGDLTVTASNSVELSSAVITPDVRFASGLFAQTQGSGDAGNLTIATRQLIVKDGAAVSVTASTDSTGRGGDLTVTASDSVELGGTSVDGELPSGLFARTRSTGSAGNLTVNTGQLIVRDRAQVTVSGVESGDAGNLDVTARSVRLENRGAILAETASGEGGNINLQVRDLILMRRNSLISAEARNNGNGGNITINTPFIIAVPNENSDIIANAVQGNGGNINIKASGIFGLQYRDLPTPTTSDINASSDFGVDGAVEIDTPDIEPSQGLSELPVQPIDTEIVQACQPGGSQQQSEFVVTGRGGLPPTPTEALSSDAVQVDWVTLNPEVENTSSQTASTNITNPTSAPIVEAQGWIINHHGNVVLTASAAPALLHNSWQNPAHCHTSQSKTKR